MSNLWLHGKVKRNLMATVNRGLSGNERKWKRSGGDQHKRSLRGAKMADPERWRKGRS